MTPGPGFGRPLVVGIPALAAASLLSILPALLESATGGAIAFPGASSAAIALLPWLALAPLPREAPLRNGALFAGAFSLPPIALGLGLDLARGFPGRELASAVVLGWLLLLAWTFSADLAARSPASRAVYSALWLLSLPGSAALRVALGWASGPRAGAPAHAALASANPLIWIHRWGRAGGLEEEPIGRGLGAALLALIVLGLVILAHRGGRGTESVG